MQSSGRDKSVGQVSGEDGSFCVIRGELILLMSGILALSMGAIFVSPHGGSPGFLVIAGSANA